jgi:hypothetical protein
MNLVNIKNEANTLKVEETLAESIYYFLSQLQTDQEDKEVIR